jgi:tRNA dimethylallyltransferase
MSENQGRFNASTEGHGKTVPIRRVFSGARWCFLNSLPHIPAKTPVLIAGATASGKSGLSLRIAREQGGIIVNADASQVFDCWRVVTARPSQDEESQAPHRLYGHVPFDTPYSAGHWLRDIEPLLQGPDRLIIVGGTGLNFLALTEGLADIPATPPEVRAHGNALALSELLAQTDPDTLQRLDQANRARVQRAWEVQISTGRPLHVWQDDTGPPLLPLSKTVPIVVDRPKPDLDARIAARFDQMIAGGALDEVRRMLPVYDPALPAFKAIGVPELVAHLTQDITLEHARDKAVIATRRFAKRQRTWMRSRMQSWTWVDPENL